MLGPLHTAKNMSLLVFRDPVAAGKQLGSPRDSSLLLSINILYPCLCHFILVHFA